MVFSSEVKDAEQARGAARKGGQGKSDEQLEEDAIYFLVMIVVLGTPLAVGIVWRALQCLNA